MDLFAYVSPTTTTKFINIKCCFVVLLPTSILLRKFNDTILLEDKTHRTNKIDFRVSIYSSYPT